MGQACHGWVLGARASPFADLKPNSLAGPDEFRLNSGIAGYTANGGDSNGGGSVMDHFQSGRHRVTMTFPSNGQAMPTPSSGCAASPLKRLSDSSVATTTRGVSAGQQTSGLRPYSVQKTTKFA